MVLSLIILTFSQAEQFELLCSITHPDSLLFDFKALYLIVLPTIVLPLWEILNDGPDFE